jgi:diguanylate cyclase (GGDEF)-like protein
VHGSSHDSAWRAAWGALAAGLFFQIAATALRVGSGDGAGLAWISDAAALAGAACMVLGLTGLLHQHRGARAGDIVFEGVVAASAAGFVMWALFTGPSGAGPTQTAVLGPLLRFLLGWVVLWLGVRLAWLTEDNPPAYRYLIAAFACLLTVDTLAIGTAFSAGGDPRGRFPALELAAYGLWMAAVLHPSLRSRFEPVCEQSNANQRRLVAFSVGLVLLAPAVLSLRVVRGDGLDLPVVLLGSGVLPLLVIVQLFRQVRGRAGAEHRAQHDALTGLPNRLLFHDRVDVALAQARRSGSRVAVMYLDLDRFKTINDSLGHAVGNQLLQAVGRRLAASVRESDTVARMGGDEFTLLLPSIGSAADAAAVADSVLRAFTDPFMAGDRELFTSTGIGVALFPDDGTDSETLLKHADTAMYRAKVDGPNRCRFFTSDMGVRARVKLSLESSLRHAIEHGKLELHYQPKVELLGRRVVGVEALVRWRHPHLGYIAPSAFIPLAEETGLILPLGEWVMEAACRQAVSWAESGLSALPVAVNLSARQFAQNRAEDLIASVLARTGLDPRLLEIEITESVFMDGVRATSESLQRLRSLGVRCSIDDFGTGYSALHYLARMPVDTLKIDRSFVSQIGIDPSEEAIVEAIIALAHSLRMNVIAEGVETEAQASFLRVRGCEQMQGFLFSPALPPENLQHFLAGHQPAQHLGLVSAVSPRPVLHLVGSQHSAATPGRSPSHLAGLLHTVCGDGDIERPDAAAVTELLEALQTANRVVPAGRSTRRSA